MDSAKDKRNGLFDIIGPVYGLFYYSQVEHYGNILYRQIYEKSRAINYYVGRRIANAMEGRYQQLPVKGGRFLSIPTNMEYLRTGSIL